MIFWVLSQLIGHIVEELKDRKFLCDDAESYVDNGSCLPVGHPRLLFKGGTSLSKAFGQIVELSEGIFRKSCKRFKSVQGCGEKQTMHTRKSYNRHEALGVLNRVDGWFKTLAARVEEGMQGNLLERSRFKEDIP